MEIKLPQVANKGKRRIAKMKASSTLLLIEGKSEDEEEAEDEEETNEEERVRIFL